MTPTRQIAFDQLGEFATMTMLAGEREPLNSDFYLKWVKPLGFRDVLGVLVLRSGKRVAWFSVVRSGVQPRFNDGDLRQMELLSPHICRALMISDALDLQSIAATRLAETVDQLSTGIVLTEDSGRIAYMNGSAEAILKDGNALKSRDGRLVAVRPGAARYVVARADKRAWPGRRLRQADNTRFRCRTKRDRADRQRPAAAMARWPQSAGIAARRRRRHHSKSFRGRAPPMEAVARCTGSPPLNAMCWNIADSHSPQETADHLGVSINTVKTHLQKIFAKTNTARQADLVRLVARSTAPLKSKR